MKIGLVVFVLPRGAATVTTVLGDGDQSTAARFMAVIALHQFWMSGRTTPVALDTGARIAQFHFFQFILPIQVLGHAAALKVGDSGFRGIVRRGAESRLSPFETALAIHRTGKIGA